MERRNILSCLTVACLVALAPLASAQAITLHGASQFSDEHAFTKALVKFGELVKKYYGKPVEFVLHKNSELGLEDRKSTRLNSSHIQKSRMPSSA